MLRPKRATRSPARGGLLPWLVLLAGLTLAVGGAVFSSAVGRDQQRNDFEAAVDDTRSDILAEMSRHAQALRAAVGFVDGSSKVSAAEFRRFSERLDLDTHYPGTDGLAYIARVPRADADTFVESRKADGDRDFKIVEAPTFGTLPEGEDHAVTTFMAPAANWASIGFDLQTLVDTRGALLAARDSGGVAVTGRFTPFIDREALVKRDGFAMFLPVYSGGGTPATVEGRRRALRGWMALRFRGDSFVPALLARERETVRWTLFDATPGRRPVEIGSDPRPGDAQKPLVTEVDLPVGERHWKLRAEALPGFVASSERAEPTLVLAGGGTLALLLFALVFVLTRSRARAERMVTSATRDLRANEQRFRTLATHSPVGIFRSDSTGNLVYENAQFREIFGLEPADVIDPDWQRALHPGDRDAVVEGWDVPGAGTAERSSTFKVMLAERGERWVQSRAAPLYDDDDGSLTGFVGTVEDITDRRAFEAQLAHRALHDPLTGLPNRVLFLDRVGLALSRAQRGTSRVAVLFLDLDRFKLVNDSFGHDVGDRLLQAVAGRLDEGLRAGDTVARLGGDEFAFVCDVEDEAEARAVAERIGEAVEKPIQLDAREVIVTTSVGIAMGTSPQHTPLDLLRDADAAMYRAKDGGKARVETFDEDMRGRALERLSTESALRRAIEANGFLLSYQPIVRLDGGEMAGVEALVRWCDSERGMVPPDSFIPLAEETGLIVPLGRWVLSEACLQAASWSREHPGAPLLTMAVNLSARQLAHPSLLDSVREILDESGLDPAALHLEITESAIMRNPEAAAGRLTELKDLGVVLSLDDFGTGYSSLAYLKRFPVDRVKIDRSFVSELAPGTGDLAIVEAIQRMAEALGLSVVAEGIETDYQHRALTDLGIEFGQGFLFARPSPATILDDLLEAGPRTRLPAVLVAAPRA